MVGLAQILAITGFSKKTEFHGRTHDRKQLKSGGEVCKKGKLGVRCFCSITPEVVAGLVLSTAK